MEDSDERQGAPLRMIEGDAPSRQAAAEALLLKIILGTDEESDAVMAEQRAKAELRRTHPHLRVVK